MAFDPKLLAQMHDHRATRATQRMRKAKSDHDDAEREAIEKRLTKPRNRAHEPWVIPTNEGSKS